MAEVKANLCDGPPSGLPITSTVPAGDPTKRALDVALVSGSVTVVLGTVAQGDPNADSSKAWWVRILDGHDATLGAKADAAAAADTSTASLIALFKRLLQRFTSLLDQTFQISTRERTSDTAFLWNANGSASVAADSFATVASLTVPTGKKLRLLFAEGDYIAASGIANRRGVRIQQAGTTRAVCFTGADNPNPDIEGLILENTSGADEAWAIQMYNGAAVGSLTMHGWMSWCSVED